MGLKVTKRSNVTGKEHTLELDITLEQYERFMKGELIQVAFPNLSKEHREFILTGITPEEWAKIFPPEPEDDKEESDAE